MSLMEKVILKAGELGNLTPKDNEHINALEHLYSKAIDTFPDFQDGKNGSKEKLIKLYDEMGKLLQGVCQETKALNVYSFLSSRENQCEASRIIAKVRNINTDNLEFVYYTQRAFEMLFKLAWGGIQGTDKNYIIVKTPVTAPVQNYAIHKITNIDKKIENTVMCVLLRGALLPSMILSKEIEEFSSNEYVTPFALFNIKRNGEKKESNMEYILNIEHSYFSPENLNGKDLVFADPMNATGGSIITVVNYLLKLGVKPKSILVFNLISALKGALRIIRAFDNSLVYTLWMDPVLNEKAYIMPGLGDAGDRINGADSELNPRGILQLISDYRCGIANLYRSQLRKIEETVLGRKK